MLFSQDDATPFALVRATMINLSIFLTFPTIRMNAYSLLRLLTGLTSAALADW